MTAGSVQAVVDEISFRFQNACPILGHTLPRMLTWSYLTDTSLRVSDGAAIGITLNLRTLGSIP